MVLGGCGPKDEPGTIGYFSGFLGGAAADEPRAALVARDILSAGGSAGDAAVALAFTLTVTYPSSAGLGGGGSCIALDVKQNRVDAIDFWPHPGRGAAGGRDAVAVPGFVRGMSVLHARYGRLPWAQVLAPAENLARFGDQVSRALAGELAEAGPQAQAAPGVRALFAAGAGGATEGATMRQPDLAGVLGQVRARGGGEFYVGPLARRIAEAIAAQDGRVSLDDLRAYAPQVAPAPNLRYGNNVMSVTANPGGIATRTLGILLTQGRDETDIAENLRPHLFVDAVARARIMGERANMGGFSPAEASRMDSLANPPPNLAPAAATEMRRPGATGFIAVDRDGGAVSCVLTMNAPFGTGRPAQGTGMFLAPATPDPGVDGAALLVHNPNSKLFAYAGAASGGPAAPGSLFAVVQRAMNFAMPLDGALRQPRLHHVGLPALVQAERTVDADTLRGLDLRRHRVAPVAVLGRVNAMYCPRGIPNTGSRLCGVAVDPRGAGLAVSADK
jgi:gamma-glutamyltranspeptidase/glutathione hydrolase